MVGTPLCGVPREGILLHSTLDVGLPARESLRSWAFGVFCLAFNSSFLLHNSSLILPYDPHPYRQDRTRHRRIVFRRDGGVSLFPAIHVSLGPVRYRSSRLDSM